MSSKGQESRWDSWLTAAAEPGLSTWPLRAKSTSDSQGPQIFPLSPFSGKSQLSDLLLHFMAYHLNVDKLSWLQWPCHLVAKCKMTPEPSTLQLGQSYVSVGRGMRRWWALSPQSQGHRPHQLQPLISLLLIKGKGPTWSCPGRVRRGKRDREGQTGFWG